MTDKLPAGLADIPGWFGPTDQQLFTYFLTDGAPAQPADLVELGVFMGKSACLIGAHLRAGERFVVCDLFDSQEREQAIAADHLATYANLTRQRFEDNYRALLGEPLPEIVHGPSSTIVDHVPEGTARFVHVDASHLFPYVVVDAVSAQKMLGEEGIVVFDDYRARHTPGVAAAVWGAVERGPLAPICLTSAKFYGTYGDPDAARERLKGWLTTSDTLRTESQQIGGREVVRVWTPGQGRKKTSPDLAVQLRRLNRKVGRIEAGLGLAGTPTAQQQGLLGRLRAALRPPR